METESLSPRRHADAPLDPQCAPLGFGLLSVAVGGGIAAVGHEQRALLAAGISTASFGAVNAALAFGLLDLSGARERKILAERARDPGKFAALKESEARPALTAKN